MRIWKHSYLDVIMLALSVVQLVTTLFLAILWEGSSTLTRVGGFMLLVGMTVYNIIVVTHLFTHTPWFRSPLLNRMVSLLNSINIGQSVQVYELTHVRNHHRYNNDQRRADGNPQDLSSTFRDGAGGEHVSIFRYAVFGAIETLVTIGRALFSVIRLWRVGAHEDDLLKLVAKAAAKRAWELRQIQLDRMAHFLVAGLVSGDLVEMVFVLLPAGVRRGVGPRQRAELLRTLWRSARESLRKLRQLLRFALQPVDV